MSTRNTPISSKNAHSFSAAAFFRRAGKPEPRQWKQRKDGGLRAFYKRFNAAYDEFVARRPEMRARLGRPPAAA